MGLELCPECKKMHFQTNPCAQMLAKRSAAVAPKRQQVVMVARQSGKSLTAAITKILSENPSIVDAGVVVAHDNRVRDLPPSSEETLAKIAEAQSKAGRPRIHPDRKAYKAAKEREYRKRRAALKEAK